MDLVLTLESTYKMGIFCADLAVNLGAFKGNSQVTNLGSFTFGKYTTN